MNCGDITFFKAGISDDLANKLFEQFNKPTILRDALDLLNDGLKRKAHDGRVIINTANQAFLEFEGK